VTTRHTFDIPHLDYDSQVAGITLVEKQTEEQRQAFDLSKFVLFVAFRDRHICSTHRVTPNSPPLSPRAQPPD
jgi:hypothetical protein